jgi:hypothetical protein
LAEIHSLSDALDAILTKKPHARERDLARLAPRRHQLLETHLGRPVKEDFEVVHCVGDSNTTFFAGAERLRFIRYRRQGLLRVRWINRCLDLLPLFRTYHLGPTTAWKAGDYGSSTRAREKLEILLRKDIRPPARILLSIGEIDCRVHISRSVLAGQPVATLVERTAEKFVKLPLWLRSLGYRPVVWGPPQIVPKDENLSSPTFPFIGPLEHRRDIIYAYIDRLQDHCARHDIPCVCLTGLYHPPAERIPLDFFCDGVHLSQRLMPLALQELERVGAIDC